MSHAAIEALQRARAMLKAHKIDCVEEYAIIDAALANTQGGVKVKELEWYKSGHGTERADTILGRYKVWRHTYGDGKFFWMNDVGNDGAEKTLEAAKAAAQQDYETRILSAITLQGEPVGEAVTDDPTCTDCDGEGLAYQTECYCACDIGIAMKSEYDRQVVTDKKAELLVYRLAELGHVIDLKEAREALSATLAHQPVTAGWGATDAIVEVFHTRLMSELFLICQPNRGDVFSFMDDQKSVIRTSIEAALKSEESCDGGNHVLITRETARLSLSAIDAQNADDAYHNYISAGVELRGVLKLEVK